MLKENLNGKYKRSKTGFRAKLQIIFGYFGTLICPYRTKSLLRLHGFLLALFSAYILENPHKQRAPCKCAYNFV